MVTELAAPAPPNGDHKRPEGHCSRCGKVWTRAEPQGVCQWCGKRATCQVATSKPRRVNSRRRKRAQNTGIGKDYDQLPEPHLTYYNVASRFTNKAMVDDQQDLLHDIIYHLAKVHQNNGNKPMTEAMMYRIASHVKDHYWYDLRKRTSGLDCGHCSKAQRHKCKENWLYGDCPKAIKLESLNKPIIDGEGNLTELGELIADDKALDLDAWLDAGKRLNGFPPRLVGIAWKIEHDEQLTGAENYYLHKWRGREQIKLL